MNELEITNFAPADQEDLIEFFATVLAELGFAFDLAAKDQDLCDFPGRYQSNRGLFLLARSSGQLMGTAALRQISPDICELKRFYVRSDHRRQGIGTQLLKRVIDHAKAGPWRRLRLDTTSKSPAALSLFRRSGFAEIQRYNDDPFAEIFMELMLD